TYDAVLQATAAADAPLLLGTNDYSIEGGRYNASQLWSVQSGLLAQNNKQRPAPFAEYIPMRDFARIFSEDVDRVQTDMVAGSEPGVIAMSVPALDRTVALGVVICFEVAYDSIVRDAVVNGAEVLLVQTNNANFG